MPDPKQSRDSSERQDVERRRRHFFGATPEPIEHWGLALSGGGIRSATFCLGVLQSLARAGIVQINCGPPRDGAAPPVEPSQAMPLLARFDFLSTVSGGGYVGAFLSGLYRRYPAGAENPDASPIAGRSPKWQWPGKLIRFFFSWFAAPARGR